MAARKQFLNLQPVDDGFKATLERARTRVVTEEMLREQRVSFAFGNALENEGITKETVRATSQRLSVRS